MPCIRVETTEPVTLHDCILTGAGDLIQANVPGAQLTVVNCRGYGLLPSYDQTRRGRFLQVNAGRSVRVEHNYFSQTTGIVIYQWSGDGSPSQTLTVRYNQCRNVNGRFRDGGEEYSNFLGLNGVLGLDNMEASWNEVINEPNKSLVADNVNFYNSGGTRTSPARLHENYIQGAYPFPATSSIYTGSGITTDGDGRTPLSSTAYVDGYSNQVISTCNAAINIAAGHDNNFHDNRLVTSGLLSDGTKMVANYAAAAIFNYYKRPTTIFYSNSFTNNVVGFVHWGGTSPYSDRQDLSPNLCVPCTGTTHLPNPITLQTEQAEWTRWQQKLRHHHIQVGPVSTIAVRPQNAVAQTRQ